MYIKTTAVERKRSRFVGVGGVGDLRGWESLVALHMLSSGRTLKLSPAVKRLGGKTYKMPL